MGLISLKQLYDDIQVLFNEYKREDKHIYEKLYKELFDETERYLVCSKPLPRLSWCVHDILIFIDRYPNKVKTYFISGFAMQNYTLELREDPIIRRYTKLCFYIEENIESYDNFEPQ